MDRAKKAPADTRADETRPSNITDSRLTQSKEGVNAAEKAVLGSLLLSNSALDNLDALKPVHFYSPRHQIVFSAILELSAESVRADLITVTDTLMEKGDVEKVGGASAIADLTSCVPTAANARHYADIVMRSYYRRETVKALRLAQEALDSGATVDEALSRIDVLPRGELAPKRRIFSRLGDIELLPPQWLVKGLCEANSLLCDFGASGAYKTFRAVDISACVATGTDYQGFKTTKQGPVIFIAGEGHAGLARRFSAWGIVNGIDMTDAPIYPSCHAVALGDSGALTAAVREIDDIAKKVGPPVLIVVDTLSRNFSGDENSSNDMPQFVAALDGLRSRYGATVYVIHHTGHSAKERSRGHSAFRAAMDWEYRIERDGGEAISAVCTKSKDCEPPEPLAFELHIVDINIADADGALTTSAVLRRTDLQRRNKKAPKLGKNKAKALEVLNAIVSAHVKNVVDSGREPEDARVSRQDWRNGCVPEHMDRKRFSEAWQALKDDALITLDDHYVDVANP
jgi:hypothetical protein